MIELKSVDKPSSPFESLEVAPAAPPPTEGHGGAPTTEVSRSLKQLVVKGKSGPIAPPFESVIGTDERVRILDTDLSPWRMICALRMRGPTGAGAIGTGWFIGPKTVVTAGHCVFSNHFFGGWATSIEVIPGLLGAGPESETRPYGSITSESLSSIDLWTEKEDPDFDMGCIHLSEPKGDEVGWFSLAALEPDELVGYLVNVSGYPATAEAGRSSTTAPTGSCGRPSAGCSTRSTPTVARAARPSGSTRTTPRGRSPSASTPTASAALRPTSGSWPTRRRAIIPEVLETLKGWVEQDGGWPGG